MGAARYAPRAGAVPAFGTPRLAAGSGTPCAAPTGLVKQRQVSVGTSWRRGTRGACEILGLHWIFDQPVTCQAPRTPFRRIGTHPLALSRFDGPHPLAPLSLRERGNEGRAFESLAQDRVEALARHIAVPDAHHAVPGGFAGRSASGVVGQL